MIKSHFTVEMLNCSNFYKRLGYNLECDYMLINKSMHLCVFPGNISTSVKQEVSSVSSNGPESCASAQ